MNTIIAVERGFDDWELLRQTIDNAPFTPTSFLIGEESLELALSEFYPEKSVKVYKILWNSLDAEGAKIKLNNFGKEYNANAPMDRDNNMIENADALIEICGKFTNIVASRASRAGLEVYSTEKDEDAEVYNF